MTKTATAKDITTWLAAAFLENPDQVFSVDPLDDTVLLADPANNSRGYTPEIGSKELSEMIENMESYGQTTPGFAVMLEDGRASLYAGFRRLRSRQTMEKARLAAGGKIGEDSTFWFRLIITQEQLSEQEMFERSLSENVFRTEMTIMQKVAALIRLTADPGETGGNGLTLTQAAKKMNMAKSAASVYVRFDLFPAVTKKAMNAGKIRYNAAEGLVALLPTAKQLEDEPEESAGDLLIAAQDKIAAKTEKLLAKGKVTGAAVDKEMRKTAGADGKAANTKQRRPKAIIDELDEETAKVKAGKEGASKTVQEDADRLIAQLAAIKRFVNGGTLKGLVKALVG